MAEVTHLPPLFLIGLSVFAFGGIATMMTQLFTMRRWNLTSLFYGIAMSSLIWGAILFIDELSRTLKSLAGIRGRDEMLLHVTMADGVSTALSCLFVAGTIAGGLILVGSVLAYVREWMFREVL